MRRSIPLEHPRVPIRHNETPGVRGMTPRRGLVLVLVVGVVWVGACLAYGLTHPRELTGRDWWVAQPPPPPAALPTVDSLIPSVEPTPLNPRPRPAAVTTRRITPKPAPSLVVPTPRPSSAPPNTPSSAPPSVEASR
jgi:hypothetical protein